LVLALQIWPVCDVALNDFLEVSGHLESVADRRQVNVLHASELLILLAKGGLVKRRKQLLMALLELG